MKRGIALLILAGAALRLAGLFDDFWLDEIWSWQIAGSMKSIADVLFSPAARYDNNHPLNTILMYAIGDQQRWWIWRLPALVAGIGSVILVADIMRRRGRAQMMIGTILYAASYPLIFFSSEARGYSQAVFFALLALDALDRYLDRRTIAMNLLFCAACVLGFSAHLTFLDAYAGMLAWSLYRLVRRRETFAQAMGDFARLHVVPIGFFCFLYVVFIRHLTIGGSPPVQPFVAIVEAIGQLFASGSSRAALIAASVVAAALLAWTVLALLRAKSDWWILVLVAVVIAPALLLARQLISVEPRQPIAARYFIVPYAMLLLGAARAIAPLDRRIVIALLTCFVAANLWQTARFLHVGRGHYSDAVAYMAEQTTSPVITVLGDDALRTSMVLDFYATRVGPAASKRFIIYDVLPDDDPRVRQRPPPMWVVVHNNAHHQPPPDGAGAYVLSGDFDYYGLSGYSWYLYRAPRN